MKTNITRVILLSAVVFTLFCQCKEDDSITGTISGTITLETGSALSGFQLYLIDYDFEADTLNFENNRAAFIDSTVSDALGAYRFTNIPKGNYAVVPLPGELQYRFSYAPISDENPVSVGNEKQEYTLNFTAQDMSMFDAGQFTIRLNIKNAPEGINCYIRQNRALYIVFIPNYEPWGSKSFKLPENSNVIDFTTYYGYTGIFVTMSNNFHFEFNQLNSSIGGYDLLWEHYINLPLTGCPALNTYEVDWASQTVTQKY
jgi:hypothetical protein